MTDYRQYRDYVGISNGDMTKALQKDYSMYSKILSSFVNNPTRYGVALLNEAEKLLVDTFGPGPGLQSIPFDGEVPEDLQSISTAEAAPKKVLSIQTATKTENRTKPNRVTFRLTDETYSRVLELKAKDGYASMQDLIEALLLDYLERADEKGKHQTG